MWRATRARDRRRIASRCDADREQSAARSRPDGKRTTFNKLNDGVGARGHYAIGTAFGTSTVGAGGLSAAQQSPSREPGCGSVRRL